MWSVLLCMGSSHKQCWQHGFVKNLSCGPHEMVSLLNSDLGKTWRSSLPSTPPGLWDCFPVCLWKHLCGMVSLISLLNQLRPTEATALHLGIASCSKPWALPWTVRKIMICRQFLMKRHMDLAACSYLISSTQGKRNPFIQKRSPQRASCVYSY